MGETLGDIAVVQAAKSAGRVIPRQLTPPLSFAVLGGGTWDLDTRKPERFTMVVAYRGYHCPVCNTYLRELDRLLPEFEKRGIDVVTVSSDTAERADLARDRWGLQNLKVGYGLSIDEAREWGLYVSRSRGKSTSGIEEPEIFSEPGVFVIRPDGTLYWASYQTMPFARPHFSEMLQAFDLVERLNYPARGEA